MRSLWCTSLVLASSGFLLTHCGKTERPNASGASGSGTSNSSTTGPTVPPEIYCFAAGTPIATPHGEVGIETLRVGDQVLAYDHAQGELVVELVSRVMNRLSTPTLLLDLSNGSRLETTPEHPFFTGEAGYVPALALSGEARLLTLGQGHESTQTGVVRAMALSSGPADTVYNLSVSGHQNYFAEGVLVHNKSPDECPFNPARCPDERVEVDDTFCIPPLHEWHVCQNGSTETGALLFDTPAADAMVGAGGARSMPSGGGQAGVHSGAAGKAGDSGVAELVAARAGSKLCNSATAPSSDRVFVEVMALEAPVRGRLSLELSSDICGLEGDAPVSVELNLDRGQRSSACLLVSRTGDHLRLNFESPTGEASQLLVTQVRQGCD